MKYPDYAIKPIIIALLFSSSNVSLGNVKTEYAVTDNDTVIEQMSVVARSLGNNSIDEIIPGDNIFKLLQIRATADLTGVYDIGQSSAPEDTAMFIYKGEFDPDSPSNPFAFNDDAADSSESEGCDGSPGLCPRLAGVSIDEGQVYTLVISTFRPDTQLSLPQSFFSIGPGRFTFYIPPENIPFTSFVPVSTQHTSGIAHTLDNIWSSTDNEANALIRTLALQPDSQETLIMRQLTPVTSKVTEVSGAKTISGTFATISNRLALLKSGPHASETGISTGTPSSERRHFWLKGFGYKTNQKSVNSFAGYDSRIKGLVIGFDTSLKDQSIVGLAASYAQTSASMANYRKGDKLDVSSFQLTGYSSKDFGRWYLDSFISYTRHKYENKRNTGLSGIARASYNGDQLTANVKAHFPFKFNVRSQRFTLTPFAGGELSRIRQDAYTEKNAGSLNLAVQNHSVYRKAMLLGGSIESTFQVTSSLSLIPSLEFTWRKELHNDGVDVASGFVSGGSFITKGQSLSRDSYSARAGLKLYNMNNFTATVGLEAIKGDGFDGFGGTIEGKWAF